MIVRFNIELSEDNQYAYRVSYEGEDLFGDQGLSSIAACIDAATEGLGQGAIGAEVAYNGIISGTYPLATLALATQQLADHALNTTAAIQEVAS